MKALLKRRYKQVSPGNGPRYVLGFEVRNQAGFGGYHGPRLRTCDLIAMDTWESGPVRLIGHEVKVARSDWLRERKDPDKAMAFIPHLAEWWLVAASLRVVDPSEVPGGWGLMVVAGESLRAVVQPRRVPQPPLDLGLMTAFARAVAGLGRAELARAKQPRPHTVKTVPMLGSYDAVPYDPDTWAPVRSEIQRNGHRHAGVTRS